VRPVNDGSDRRGQLLAFLRQRIFNADGSLRDDPALDETFLFELLETLAEHPVRDVRNGGAQRGEPAACLQEHENDRARPAAAD